LNGKDSFDLKAFLNRYGIFIYTGDPAGDLLLIEDEIRELRQLGLIDNEEFIQALAAVKQRAANLKRG
jgi:uncharacterized protein YqgQ